MFPPGYAAVVFQAAGKGGLFIFYAPGKIIQNRGSMVFAGVGDNDYFNIRIVLEPD
jgi:hypothetical protein